MKARPAARAAMLTGIGLVLAFLYLPLVPPVLFGAGGYAGIRQNPILVDAVRNSLLLAALTALVTPPLALLGAMAVRELRVPRLVLLVLLLPLFVPGVSMGLATAVFLKLLGVTPSLRTILLVHVMWTLPFAFLVVLAAMATFDPVYLEAAYVLGAPRLRAFLDVELPLIRPGLLGAASLSAIVSLNETIRTSLVQGPLNTVQTYIWTTYLQVGLSPSLHALMSLLIGLTLALVAVLLVGKGRRGRVVTG
ncbi:MAG TPA: hypothetical protein VF406_11595 [Thermodesulfobacteriota bacterium]